MKYLHIDLHIVLRVLMTALATELDKVASLQKPLTVVLTGAFKPPEQLVLCSEFLALMIILVTQ